MSGSLFDLGPISSSSEPNPDTPDVRAESSRAPQSQTQSLYRRYRPQSFDADELVGQEHIVRTLRNAVERGRVAHAYLFCGPRGTGKTTTARLLTKAVNCLDPDPQMRPCNRCANCIAINTGATTDVIEIDAASNRGIDDIRDLRERVKYAPTQLSTKFYIIDEAHQITGAAANAFLKTLEEPPPHTRFVLATTDPEDLLPTIVSRCQRFDFRRISLPAARARIRTVADAEGVRIDDDAITAVARAGTGSLRDSLGLLDQLAVYQESDDDTSDVITAESVRALLGVSRNDRVETITRALADRDVTSALGVVSAAVEAGEDPRQLNRQLVTYLRVLLHQLAGGSPDADETARELAERFDIYELAKTAQRFSETDVRIRHASIAQLPLEVAIVESVLQPRADGAPAPSTTARPARGGREGSPDVSRQVAAGEAGRSPAGPATAAPEAGPAPDTEPARPAGPSLRDRVRGTAARTDLRATPSAASAADVPGGVTTPEPSSAAGPDPSPVVTRPTPASFAAAAANDTDGVARLVELWPRIRQDVKLQNRRIEALLAEVDPISIRGNAITLRAAYPFHRNRLEEEDVREVVEMAIGRRIGEQVRVRTVLKGDEDDDPGPATAAAAPAVAAAPPTRPARPTPARPSGPADSSPDELNGRTAPPPSPPEPARPVSVPSSPGDSQRVADRVESPPDDEASAAGSVEATIDDLAARQEQVIEAARTILDAEEVPDPLADSTTGA